MDGEKNQKTTLGTSLVLFDSVHSSTYNSDVHESEQNESSKKPKRKTKNPKDNNNKQLIFIMATTRPHIPRAPYVDPNTNIIYETDNPEYHGWLTKQSMWLKVRKNEKNPSPFGCPSFYCVRFFVFVPLSTHKIFFDSYFLVCLLLGNFFF